MVDQVPILSTSILLGIHVRAGPESSQYANIEAYDDRGGGLFFLHTLIVETASLFCRTRALIVTAANTLGERLVKSEFGQN